MKHQKDSSQTTLMLRGNPVCRPLKNSGSAFRAKAPSVTSSSRFKSSLASGFGQLSKPQVHPRAAKTTRKPRGTVSEREDQLPLQACLLPGSPEGCQRECLRPWTQKRDWPCPCRKSSKVSIVYTNILGRLSEEQCLGTALLYLLGFYYSVLIHQRMILGTSIALNLFS